MRPILLLLIIIPNFLAFGQSATQYAFEKDSLIVIGKQPEKGFYHDYILFIPKKTNLNKKTFLLVEPNNTGKTSDSIEVHKKYAISLASVSSVGNNIATALKIPLLVPIFPRPESQPLLYTHALDRDAIVETAPEMKRLDLQLIAMIEDAKKVLAAMQIPVETKVFMNGFSASGSFTNRFSMLHPEKIAALAIGGFNGLLMLPKGTHNGVGLNYPIGTNDFVKLFGKSFDIGTYRSIPQFIYMGKLDDNDAVQFDDAYSENERAIINTNIGGQVQQRYQECQKIYHEHSLDPTFKNFEGVGHWTTSAINLEVIQFFQSQISAGK